MTINSQISDNNPIDARSFAQIWESCDPGQRQKLTNRISVKLECSSVAVWNYGKGNYSPRSINDKKEIVKIIRSVLGCQTAPDTLFPSR